MAGPYADAAYYQIRYGVTLDAAGQAQVEAALAEAAAFIDMQLPQGYIPDATVARAVCAAVAFRALVNPGGLRSRQVGGVAESYDQDGGLCLTQNEIDLLLAGLNDERSGATAYTVGVRDDAYPAYPCYGQGSAW